MRTGHGDARVDAALEACDAHHEELIEVRCEDRGEIRAFQHGQRGVFGKLQHALVELEPADFAVEEPILRQRFVVARARVLLVLGFRDVLGDLAAQYRLRGFGKLLDHTFTLLRFVSRLTEKATER